jgi:hypothetical protein
MSSLELWTPPLSLSTKLAGAIRQPVPALQTRRLACELPCAAAMVAPATDEHEFTPLFAGSMEHWEMAGRGHFVVANGRLESVPGDDVGLCWCTVPTPSDFVLRLSWLRWRHEDTSGVVVRFPRPQSGPSNPAWVAAARGFEVRIDEVGIPGASLIHMTGAIFNEPAQRITPCVARPAAEWNEFEISVRGQRYAVALNGHLVSEFVNTDLARGLPSSAAEPAFIGVQVAPGSRVAFRDIRIKAL